MDRSPDHESPWRDRPCRQGRHRIGAQVNAAGAARQSDIQTIVDHDAAAAPSGHGHHPGHKPRQLGRLEIRFADLEDIDPRVDRVLGLLEQALPPAAEIGRGA